MSSVLPGKYEGAVGGAICSSHRRVGAVKSNQPVMSTATSLFARVAVIWPAIGSRTRSPVTAVELAMKYRSPPDTSEMPSPFRSATASGEARVTGLSFVKLKSKFRSTYAVS